MMRCAAKTLALLAVLFFSQNCAAAQRVVTIYFCGTGLTSEANTPSGSPWHTAELIAELYASDDSEPITQKEFPPGKSISPPATSSDQLHYKYIADGLGTDVFSWFGAIDPDFGRRGWDAVENEAFNAVTLIVEEHPTDTILLNIVGFSRGGILAMKLARRVAHYSPVSQVNILAFDPVPGGFNPIGRFGYDLVLPPKVNRFLGIYARDELTSFFEPVIPDISQLTPNAKTWLINVPGAHETMMGNFQLDGHSIFPKDFLDHTIAEGVKPVNRVARVIAQQLLTSASWGYIPLHSMAPENTETAFEQQVLEMYLYNYTFMQLRTFLPGYTGYDVCYATTKRDHHLRFTGAIPALGEKKRLCFVAPEIHQPEWVWSCALWPVWFPNPEKVYWLEDKTTTLSSSTAWDQLQRFVRSSKPVSATGD